MESSFGNQGILLLNHALNCLGKVGDDLVLHGDPGDVSAGTPPFVRLTAINSAKTGLCQVVLPERFFHRLTLDLDEQAKAHQVDAQVSLKVFRSCLRMGRDKGRQVQECEVRLKENGPESRLEVGYNFGHHLSVRHSLMYEDVKGLIPLSVPGGHLITLSSDTAKRWANQILTAPSNTRYGQVTLWCYDDICLLKARFEDLPTLKTAKDASRRGIQTSLKVMQNDVETFEVDREELLTFSLREFKAALALADALNVDVRLRFSEGGEPLFIEMQTEAGAKIVMVITTEPHDVTEDRPTDEASRPNPNHVRELEAQKKINNVAGGESGTENGGASQSQLAASARLSTKNSAVGRASRTLATRVESQPSQAGSLAYGSKSRIAPKESTPMRSAAAKKRSRADEEEEEQNEQGQEPLFRSGYDNTQQTLPMPGASAGGEPFVDEDDENDWEADQAGVDALEEYERIQATQTQHLQENKQREQEEDERMAEVAALMLRSSNAPPPTGSARSRPRAPRLSAASGSSTAPSMQGLHFPRSSSFVATGDAPEEDPDQFEPLPMDEADLEMLKAHDDTPHKAPLRPSVIVRVGTRSTSAAMHDSPADLRAPAHSRQEEEARATAIQDSVRSRRSTNSARSWEAPVAADSARSAPDAQEDEDDDDEEMAATQGEAVYQPLFDHGV